MQTVIIEPVGSRCNLRCTYCYQAPVRMSGNRVEVMPEQILERLVPDRIAVSNAVKFLWHGGEPMLAGMDFFRNAVKLQTIFNKKGIKIANYIQTNATLIDKEWAVFFAENNFKIGTSLDGPRWLHDRLRGKSYDRVIGGIQNIQETGNDVGILITLSKENVEFTEVIWQEIIRSKKIAKSFEINICSITEFGNDLVPDVEQSFKFLTTLFDWWMKKDDPEIYIRTFRTVLKFLLGGEAGDCAFEYNKCNRFAAVDEKSDVYICNRFMKRSVAYLGNVLEKDIRDILKSKRALELYEKIAKIKDECRRCEWFMCCGGGCAFQRWVSTGRFDAGFPECELRKKFFSYVKNKIT